MHKKLGYDKKKSDYSHKKERKQGKRNMDVIVQVNDAVNSFVWGVPAMVCIIGVGLWLSFRTGFIQIRKFGYSILTADGYLPLLPSPCAASPFPPSSDGAYTGQGVLSSL